MLKKTTLRPSLSTPGSSKDHVRDCFIESKNRDGPMSGRTARPSKEKSAGAKPAPAAIADFKDRFDRETFTFHMPRLDCAPAIIFLGGGVMSESPNQDRVSPEVLPERLVEGYQTFLGSHLPVEQKRYHELSVEGQKPQILIIGCCDSRVSPEVIFDAGPGELFVLRNVANLVPPYRPNDDYHGTSSALEFAVMGLRVVHVVVLGHAQCGGVKAYAESQADPYKRPLSAGDFIGSWIRLIAPAAERIGAPTEPLGEYTELLAFESIKQSLINLRTFPWIKNLEQRGMLQLHGAYFGVATGKLLALDEARGKFVPIAEREHAAVMQQARF
jgi:carbonic anhydrase